MPASAPTSPAPIVFVTWVCYGVGMADTSTTVTIADLLVGDVIELDYNLGLKVVAEIDHGYGAHWRTPGPTWAVRYTDGRGNAFSPQAPIRRLASPQGAPA